MMMTAQHARFGPLSHGERAGGEGLMPFGVARPPIQTDIILSPGPSPQGERLSFAVKAHDGRGDRMQPLRHPASAFHRATPGGRPCC